MRIATRLPGERNLAREDADRIAEIRAAIIEIGNEWRARHSWMNSHQDQIGLGIFLVSILGVIGDAVLYGYGLLPWWATIALTGFWLSILHELEHDLIHSMYFRKNKLVHNTMMFGVWFFRPSTINPWIRRSLHLHHHQVSGTDSDMEERTLTNGEGWGAHRLLSLMDSFLGMYTKPMRMYDIVRTYVETVGRDDDEIRMLANRARLSYFPLGLVHYGLWHLAIGLFFWHQLVGPTHLPGQGALNFLCVAFLAPNAIRTFCLHFVTSNMHYFGDVEAHNVLQQTQVWNALWLKPFHALCFNFGETHAIHHFLVRDPFYVREFIKKDGQRVLRDHGIRFNDFGTFRRANRFSLAGDPID